MGDLDTDAIVGSTPPGYITLTFDVTIANGPGVDIAVFENCVANDFCELAYVEVSSDGIEFARFNNTDYGAATAQVGSYAFIDATYIYGLAGKHTVGYGTPFDLEDLLSHPKVTSGLVDLDDIHFVRIVDIPGSGDWTDDSGNPIYDSWWTYGSGGADIDGIAVLNMLTEDDNDFALMASPTQGTVGEPGTSVTVTSDSIYLPGDVPVPDGTSFTIATTIGTITAADSDAGTPGIQVQSSGGMITFTLQGGTISGTALISAISTDGLIQGELSCLFTAGIAVGPIDIVQVNPQVTAPGTVIFTTSPILDDWGNPLGEGNQVTLVVTGGTPVESDAAPGEPGHQLSLSTGIADFSILVAPDKSGESTTLTVALYAEPGQLTLLGEETVTLEITQMPLHITTWLLLFFLCIGTRLVFLLRHTGKSQ